MHLPLVRVLPQHAPIRTAANVPTRLIGVYGVGLFSGPSGCWWCSLRATEATLQVIDTNRSSNTFDRVTCPGAPYTPRQAGPVPQVVDTRDAWPMSGLAQNVTPGRDGRSRSGWLT